MYSKCIYKNIILFAFLLIMGVSNLYAQSNSMAISAFESKSEDIIDYALVNNAQLVEKAIAEMQQGINDKKNFPSMNDSVRDDIKNLLLKMKQQWNEGKINEFILTDNQIFMLAINEIYKKKQSVPKDIAMMDYLGRELQFNPKIENWQKTQETAQDIAKRWSSLKKSISDDSLVDLVNTTVDSIPKVVSEKNKDELYFRGQLILDEIDLLEKYFKSKKITTRNK